jgi:hypothetical protein
LLFGASEAGVGTGGALGLAAALGVAVFAILVVGCCRSAWVVSFEGKQFIRFLPDPWI